MPSRFRDRKFRPYEIVHVTARGLNKQQIVFDAQDREFILAKLRALLNQCPSAARPKLLSYGVMGNHIHLLFQLGTEPKQLKRIMHVLKRDYGYRFNTRRNSVGQVWESPFRTRTVRGGDDLINVVTYIHLNPDASTRDTNSSHAIYLGTKSPGIISTDLILKAFGGREQYAAHFANTAALRAARAAAKQHINK